MEAVLCKRTGALFMASINLPGCEHTHAALETCENQFDDLTAKKEHDARKKHAETAHKTTNSDSIPMSYI